MFEMENMLQDNRHKNIDISANHNVAFMFRGITFISSYLYYLYGLYSSQGLNTSALIMIPYASISAVFYHFPLT